MPIKDSWRRALVFSGLVDDQPPAHPDYLAVPAPDQAAAPAGAPVRAGAPAALPPLIAPPAWQAAAPDRPDDPTDPRQREEGAPIVVRRLPASPADPGPPLSPPDEIAEIFGKAGPAAPASSPALARPATPPPPSLHRAQAPAPPPPSPAPPQEVSVLRVAPRSFNDAQLVADRFKASSPVILDMRGADTDLAKRLIGFASGLTYGLDGGMERLDDRVFLLTPRGVEIPAAQRARLAAQGSLSRI